MDETIHGDIFINGYFTGGFLAMILIEDECQKKDMTLEKLMKFVQAYEEFCKTKFIHNSNNMILGND